MTFRATVWAATKLWRHTLGVDRLRRGCVDVSFLAIEWSQFGHRRGKLRVQHRPLVLGGLALQVLLIAARGLIKHKAPVRLRRRTWFWSLLRTASPFSVCVGNARRRHPGEQQCLALRRLVGISLRVERQCNRRSDDVYLNTDVLIVGPDRRADARESARATWRACADHRQARRAGFANEGTGRPGTHARDLRLSRHRRSCSRARQARDRCPVCGPRDGAPREFRSAILGAT